MKVNAINFANKKYHKEIKNSRFVLFFTDSYILVFIWELVKISN